MAVAPDNTSIRSFVGGRAMKSVTGILWDSEELAGVQSLTRGVPSDPMNCMSPLVICFDLCNASPRDSLAVSLTTNGISKASYGGSSHLIRAP